MNRHSKGEKCGFAPIAIIGMGALFPGARNVSEFWENILSKKDCITEVAADDWEIDSFFDPDPTAADKTYCKRGGFLPPVEFDAVGFGIPPKTLESISMNQLLALKVAHDALLDAGMIGDRAGSYDKTKVGVILGSNIGGNVFPLRERVVGIDRLRKVLAVNDFSDEQVETITERLKAGYIEWSEDSFPGFLPNIVASRIANRFDFGGVSYSVDAACAGSLCAIRQAVYELHVNNCDIMLTGGVNVSNDPLSYLSFSKTPALSLSNRIRPYDKEADGLLLGDGIGMLVLKRLADAEQAGDRIYAVIKAIGSSSDGRAKSIYAPRLEGQIMALERAYAVSDITPADIGLIEGHGTGTVVGDACEIKGLKRVFEPYHIASQSIALGSVKSQIGHTTQAAGAASTIKAALALYHNTIPPMINVDEPHPGLGLENSPFYISTETRPWEAENREGSTVEKRCAAVSAFGFGGVNYHLVLAAYPKSRPDSFPATAPAKTSTRTSGKEPRHSVVLKGRQYLSPQTRRKMKTALASGEMHFSVSGKRVVEEIPMKTATADRQSNAFDKMTDALPSAMDNADLVFQIQISNSRLQEQFFQYQARQFELVERVILRRQAPKDLRTDSRGNAQETFDAPAGLTPLLKSLDHIHNAHLAYLNHQHGILAKLIGGAPAPATSRAMRDSLSEPAARSFQSMIQVESCQTAEPPIYEKKTPDRPELQQPAGKIDEGAEAVSISREQFAEKLLSVVSEQTGYPPDIIELDMDIEADLGIDSIKRVEIFSALHEAFPIASDDIDPAKLGVLKTLQEVVDFFMKGVDAGGVKAGDDFTEGGTARGSKPEVNEQRFVKTLLEIVSKHTGYPEDIIEMEMDIEADLGIDSIKRVEIFSELHEAFPGDSENVDVSKLAELTTLQAVVDFFSHQVTPPSDSIQTGISGRYEVKAVPIGLPGKTTGGPRDVGVHILITDDSGGSGFETQKALSAEGYNTTLLQFEELSTGASGSKADFSASLADMNESAIKNLLDAIVRKSGPVGGFIHINPLISGEGPVSTYFSDTESRLLKTVFFMAKNLKQPLNQDKARGRAFFLAVTRIDGKLGLNSIPPRSILQGGYSGLVKSLHREAPGILCRTIDIDPDATPAGISRIILEELNDRDNAPIEVGRVARDQRFTSGMEPVEARTHGKAPVRDKPDRNTVFLVSGGGRGVTAGCVVGLARAFKSKFILIGRTTIEGDEPEWAKGIDDPHALKQALSRRLKAEGAKPAPKRLDREVNAVVNRREIIKNLAAVRAAGGQAVYIAEDIADSAGVCKKLEQVGEDFRPISGLIHGAGSLADKYLEKKEESDYDLVYRTKVDGLKTLLDCVDLSEIRYVVLFSSISGFLGQAGQSDYALANEILNKFAHALAKKLPDAFIRAINWGPWDGGMVGPELKRIYQKLNVDVIPIEEGVQCLVDEFAASGTSSDQIIICPRSFDRLNIDEAMVSSAIQKQLLLN